MSLLRGCGGDATNYLAVATEFALHDPFDLLDTAVVLQNIVATPAATVITRCLCHQ